MQRTALCSFLIGAAAVVVCPPGIAQPIGNSEAGHDFALQVRTPCHVVDPDQLSPRRFALAPDLHAIANAPAVTGMALHAFLSSPHPTMPNLVLSPKEERDLIAYILTLKER